mgnify:CR=1 FL=1
MSHSAIFPQPIDGDITHGHTAVHVVPVSTKVKAPLSKLRHRNHRLSEVALVWHSRPPSSAAAHESRVAPAPTAATRWVGQPAVMQ